MTCSVAGSGPRLYDVMRTYTLSGDCSSFAYYGSNQISACMRATKHSQTNLDKYVPIAILIEHIRVQNLKFRNIAAAVDILPDKLLVRIPLLWVLVQEFHIGVCRRRIKVIVDFFHVFAVIPLVSGHAKQTLLEDRILLIPQRDGEAQALAIIRDACNTVLAPSICA